MPYMLTETITGWNFSSERFYMSQVSSKDVFCSTSGDFQELYLTDQLITSLTTIRLNAEFRDMHV